MTSDYAQTFFKNDEKDKTREPNSGRGSQVRVRQVAVKTKKETQGLPQQTAHELPGNSFPGNYLVTTNYLVITW